MLRKEILRNVIYVSVFVCFLLSRIEYAKAAEVQGYEWEPVPEITEDVIEEAEQEAPKSVFEEDAYFYLDDDALPTPEGNGFLSYDIPEIYAASGGSFPADLQEYTYILCEQMGVSYSLIVAMIEVESHYRADAVSGCNAVGYMQVIEKWHRHRMEKYGFDNLTDPQANITVGIDIMAELLARYPVEQALVIYNEGPSGAGKTSSSYSRAVVQRKAELENEFD